MNRRSWRLLVHGRADGAWNMAVDEALLEERSVEDDPGSVTLRLYGWSPAALSLGRNQPARGSYDPAYLRREAIDLVRRPTGGLAVLHDEERTFSLVGPIRSPEIGRSVLAVYHRISQVLVEAMRGLGIRATTFVPPIPAARSGSAIAGPACFEVPSTHEIGVAGRKLIGSAQLRRREVFLQHGSIPLRDDPARLGAAVGTGSRRSRATSLERLLGRVPPVTEVDAALVCAFEDHLGVRLIPGEMRPEEFARAVRLRSWKYLSASWTRGGRIGDRERRAR